MAGNIFDPVTIGWQGREYVVPAERVLKLIYHMEMAITLDGRRMNIFDLLANPPLSALSMVYGAALRFAGADVADDEVYGALIASLGDDTPEAVRIRDWCEAISAIILPESSFRNQDPEKPGKKAKAA